MEDAPERNASQPQPEDQPAETGADATERVAQLAASESGPAESRLVDQPVTAGEQPAAGGQKSLADGETAEPDMTEATGASHQPSASEMGAEVAAEEALEPSQLPAARADESPSAEAPEVATAESTGELRSLARAITTDYDPGAEFREEMGIIIGTREGDAYHIRKLVRVTEFAPESKPEYLLPDTQGLSRLIDQNVREGEQVIGAYHNHAYLRLLWGAAPGPSSPDLPGLVDVLSVPGKEDKIAGELLGIVLEPEFDKSIPIDQLASYDPSSARVKVYSWVSRSRSGPFDKAPESAYLDAIAGRDGGRALERADGDLGGIDLRRLPVRTRLSPGPADLYPASVAGMDIDREWRRIGRMMNGGLQVSAQRIGEFAAACRMKGRLSAYSRDLLSCVASILRSEEESGQPTEGRLRELLDSLEEELT